ncbi:putative conjugal transfer proteinc [Methanobrevibacter cuticularis]|uniref:Putative conjugal transfer proteinc n=1 Tax=Methanobrevibacter cuticularis TaxID=47311 RepID=A0A166DEP9_9EURY|nr:CpaF family protein [Methanobrevibacter cuticularis]KZX15514.1 putative conjugal transfer proteinc [Methanobrevibacter cuticularis]
MYSKNKGNIIPKYKLMKPKFSNEEKNLLKELRSNLVDLAISSGNDFNFDEIAIINDIKNYLKIKMPKIQNNLEKNNENLDIDTYIDNLASTFFQYIIGYGEIDSLIKDDNLEEIMIIGINKPVFVYHRENGMMESNLIFQKEEEITSIIDSVARQINRRIDQESPILDGRLEDGSRVNATISPISADGPSMTIRKFKKDPLTIIDLINSNTLNCDLAAFFWLCVDGLGVKPANAIISGGTSSGKTTTLNALAAFINPRERIITIEDTLELQIPHKHIVRMETRPGNIENKGELNMDDLVKNSLRQRPDRVIVGEVRGKEAVTLFTALNTGHSGFGTLHSNNSRETITRLTNSPMNVPKVMISAIDFIIMQNRIYRSDGVSVRRIIEVDEVVGMEEGTIQLNKIFKWNGENDNIENVGISSNTLRSIANIRGIPVKSLEGEIAKRKRFLELLVDNNIRNIEDVGNAIENYYIDPKDAMNDILNLKQ